MPPPSYSDDRPPPSEHVRLEADLAVQGGAERAVWIFRAPGERRLTVLVVEADPGVRARVVRGPRRALFPGEGPAVFRVETAASAAEALEQIRRGGVDVVVCGDLGVGAEALHEALGPDPASRVPSVAYIALTGDGAVRSATAEALRDPPVAAWLGAAVATLLDRSGEAGLRTPPSG